MIDCDLIILSIAVALVASVEAVQKGAVGDLVDAPCLLLAELVDALVPHVVLWGHHEAIEIPGVAVVHFRLVDSLVSILHQEINLLQVSYLGFISEEVSHVPFGLHGLDSEVTEL